ncbi:LysR family transcriptional regulator [Streptomyces sp. NPDC020681]|uniref:LysR family transcriptional regulator n=1 Tax=Streptomyces sp. NPDC020681 TaxID=3365083 RepID=UPI00378954BC
MRPTHIRGADLNLLEALAVLLEERHVSRAAERFHLSQPAMSRTLQRARDTFGDELLVRTRSGYELTPRAGKIQAELTILLPRLETVLRGDVFDPATATDFFRIQCTDYATTLLGPHLFQQVFHQAPGVSLTVEPMSDTTFEDMEHGRVHLTISGVVPPGTLRWETLFDEEFVCLLSRDHPVTASRLTMAEYVSHPHVMVTINSAEQTVVERRLAEFGLRRPTGLRVPYHSAAATALPGTPLIATLPRRMPLSYADDPALRIAETPPELQPFPYGITWHPRLDGDPAAAWLRGIVRESAHATR